MSENKRKNVTLSEICCQCLKTIQDVAYATAYTIFCAQDSRMVQQRIRKISPKVQQEGDWLRIRVHGMGLVFSIRDEAIALYKPIIQEFQCFGSAVRILGVYENYISKIVELSCQCIPGEMDKFNSDHRKLFKNKRSLSIQNFWSDKLGRGIDFFQEVFGWNPQPKYRPALRLMFHIRNLTVHNASIADQKLCQLASNQHIELIGTFKVGDRVPWNLGTNLELQHLVIGILSEADPYIAHKLDLPTLQKRAFWREDSQNSVR